MKTMASLERCIHKVTTYFQNAFPHKLFKITAQFNSVSLEFESKKKLGTLSVWTNGCIDLLVYDIQSGIEIENNHFTFKEISQLERIATEQLKKWLE